MKHNLFFVFWVTLCINTSDAQDSILISQINAQVWLPFIEAYNTNNDSLFQSVHSLDVTRVIQDDSRILDYNSYFAPQSAEIQLRKKLWSKQIELRCIQRIQDHTNAFEVGYYKASSKHRETGESHIFYGKFHVLLKKEHGIWKILMDADTAEHISEELFQSASPLVQRK